MMLGCHVCGDREAGGGGGGGGGGLTGRKSCWNTITSLGKQGSSRKWILSLGPQGIDTLKPPLRGLMSNIMLRTHSLKITYLRTHPHLHRNTLNITYVFVRFSTTRVFRFDGFDHDWTFSQRLC